MMSSMTSGYIVELRLLVNVVFCSGCSKDSVEILNQAILHDNKKLMQNLLLSREQRWILYMVLGIMNIFIFVATFMSHDIRKTLKNGAMQWT